MRRALAALTAVAATAAFAHAANAAAPTFVLMSPNGPVTPPPPLAQGATGQRTPIELQVPDHVDSRQFVVVGIGPDGVPVRVTATQRLRITGTGDYSFVVPAPVTGLVPGPGSESQPGLRDIGILWQGFSDRQRVLSAVATLRPREAATGLPLRVQVERQGGATVVVLENLTHRRVALVTCCATRSAVATTLARLRAASRPLRIVGSDPYINGIAHKGSQVDVSAPLRITGVISSGSSRVPVDERLGGDRPLVLRLTVPGATEPTLRLRVELLPPIEMLPTQAELAHARRPLVALEMALGAIATSSAYRHYLASPDLLGANEAAYVYRSVPRPAAAVARTRDHDSDTLAILLGAMLGAAALAGLATWWARS